MDDHLVRRWDFVLQLAALQPFRCELTVCPTAVFAKAVVHRRGRSDNHRRVACASPARSFFPNGGGVTRRAIPLGLRRISYSTIVPDVGSPVSTRNSRVARCARASRLRFRCFLRRWFTLNAGRRNRLQVTEEGDWAQLNGRYFAQRRRPCWVLMQIFRRGRDIAL